MIRKTCVLFESAKVKFTKELKSIQPVLATRWTHIGLKLFTSYSLHGLPSTVCVNISQLKKKKSHLLYLQTMYLLNMLKIN